MNKNHARGTRPRRRSIWECPSRKLRYRDRREALAALWSTQNARHEGYNQRQERRIYRCNMCKGWHLTSKEFRSRQKPSS